MHYVTHLGIRLDINSKESTVVPLVYVPLLFHTSLYVTTQNYGTSP